MNITDRLCYAIAPVLGANIFKKYWPVKGSYWNKTHMKSNDVFDLNQVIDQANEFTRQHVQLFLMEFIIVVMCYLTGYLEPSKCIAFMPISIIICAYPLMIHHYNRILARSKIKELEKSQPKSEKLEVSEDHPIIISSNSHEYYLRFDYDHISPMLRSNQTAVALREYYYMRMGRNKYDISAFLFMNDAAVRELWQGFLEDG
jgi:hypothetical protein